MSAKRFVSVAVALLALTTAACGGGGGGAVPSAPAVLPASTPAPIASVTPGAGAQSFAVSGAPAITSGTLSLTSPASIQVAFSATTPTGSALSKKRKPSAIGANGGAALAYVTVSSDEGATLTQIGGAFTLASAVPPGQSAFTAVWDGANWNNVSSTPGTVSGTTVTFALTNLSPAVTADPNAFFAIFYNTAALATPSPAPAPTATPSAPAGTFVDAACPQAMAAATNTVVPVTNFFSSIVPAAHTICISAWDLSGDLDTALIAAAHAGASVTVITPYSQNSSNATAIGNIVAAGGHAKYEYTSSQGTSSASIAFQHAAMDIHAKFAIVDGVAYMDGHNWFATDVVVRDGFVADYAAIQSDLVNFPASPPSGSGTTAFTTDKQVSLKSEGDFLQNVAIPALGTGAANEYDFITESFNPNNAAGNFNDDVYAGMCQISALPSAPLMKLVLEEESGYSTAAKTALQSLGLRDANADVRTNNNGHEKISMIRLNGTPVAAWFGSSNATTTDLFDWGMTTTDPTVLSALAAYFDNTEFAHATAITPGLGTPAACGTVH